MKATRRRSGAYMITVRTTHQVDYNDLVTILARWAYDEPTGPPRENAMTRKATEEIIRETLHSHLSGEPHVHPDDGSDTFGPCPLHPDAPGDR